MPNITYQDHQTLLQRSELAGEMERAVTEYAHWLLGRVREAESERAKEYVRSGDSPMVHLHAGEAEMAGEALRKLQEMEEGVRANMRGMPKMVRECDILGEKVELVLA